MRKQSTVSEFTRRVRGLLKARPLSRPRRGGHRAGRPLRVVALIAAYNEERFLAPVLRHLREQGVEAVLFDNDSTDNSLESVRPFLGEGLLAIERIPRNGRFAWADILRQKAATQDRVEADWFLHMDPDEFRFPPPGHPTLRDWVSEADRQGYNALNFQEFTFLPCREAPDHDHPDFQNSMRWYYPFRANELHRVNAWKRQPEGVNLDEMGGHQVMFSGRNIPPETGIMRHYLFLSPDHAREKYGLRGYDPAETAKGWHGWRGDIQLETRISLPSREEMNHWQPGQTLTLDNPRTEHFPFLNRDGGAEA